MTSVRRRLSLSLLVWLQVEVVATVLQMVEDSVRQAIPWEVDPALQGTLVLKRLSAQDGGCLLSAFGLCLGRYPTKARSLR